MPRLTYKYGQLCLGMSYEFWLLCSATLLKRIAQGSVSVLCSCDDKVDVCVGRLTKEQIKAGYSALQCIASYIDKAQFGPQLTAACNDFYTRIPHYFGFAFPLHTGTDFPSDPVYSLILYGKLVY